MPGGKTEMIGRMPVLTENNGSEICGTPKDGFQHFVAVGHGECSARQKIKLNIYNEESFPLSH
jgi:hypothetical protein